MSDINKIPNLEVERSYYSEGTIPNIENTESQTDSPEAISDVFDDIKTQITNIKNVSKVMPKDIGQVFNELVSNADYLLNLIDKDIYDPGMKDEEIVVTIPDVFTPETPDDSDTNNPIVVTNPTNPITEDTEFDVFSISLLDNINIFVPSIDLNLFVENNYYGDLLVVIKHYTAILHDTASKFVASLLTLSSEAGITNIQALTLPYMNKTSNVKNKNLRHLSDAIIRSSIIRRQKINLIRKLSTVRETSLHVKSCRAASEFKARYVEEKYKDPTNISDMYSNEILSDSIMMYEKKYEENFRNLYKYLNSSVILINECLNIFLDEAKGKAILIKEGEIKL
jgi:DNA-directed RNA polymerase subunit F